MATITIGANCRLTKLKSSINYNPQLNFPAVSATANGNNNFSVFALCYIPKKGKLKEKSLAEFQEGNYSGNTPTQTVVLDGNNEQATIVLSYFEGISTVDLVNSPTTEFSSRSFAVCYDFDAKGAASYECDVYALEFQYTVEEGGTGADVIFFAQGDLDPELSRGTVTAPAKTED